MAHLTTAALAVGQQDQLPRLPSYWAEFSSTQASPRSKHTLPIVRIAILHGVVVFIDGRELVLKCRKAKALLAYLALTPGMSETRDRLVGLLWSETCNNPARGSLRQILHTLRSAFGGRDLPVFPNDKFNVSLSDCSITTDLDDVLAGIDNANLSESLFDNTPITDALLRGYGDIDPAFAGWLTRKREAIRQTLIRKLEAQLGIAGQQPGTVRSCAQALIQLDPTHEIACQNLMWACVVSGNTPAALAAYKQLWTHLEDDYDIEPSAATQQLVVAIKTGVALPPMLRHPAKSAASNTA